MTHEVQRVMYFTHAFVPFHPEMATHFTNRVAVQRALEAGAGPYVTAAVESGGNLVDMRLATTVKVNGGSLDSLLESLSEQTIRKCSEAARHQGIFATPKANPVKGRSPFIN